MFFVSCLFLDSLFSYCKHKSSCFFLNNQLFFDTLTLKIGRVTTQHPYGHE